MSHIERIWAACLLCCLISGELCFAQSSQGPVYPTYDGQLDVQVNYEGKQAPKESLTSVEKVRDAKARLLAEASRGKSANRNEIVGSSTSCCSPITSEPAVRREPDRGTRADQ